MVKWEKWAVFTTLALIGAFMLWYSSISEFGDEQYFYNLAVDPLNRSLPLWRYSPLPPLLMTPITYLTSSPTLLRIPTILLALSSIFLFYLITRKHVGLFALTAIVPLVVTARLWKGLGWFYWDVFLMFFFTLTLYLIETSRTKLAFISGLALGLSKMWLGPIFILPLLLKNRWIVAGGLAYLPIVLVSPSPYLLNASTLTSASVQHASFWWLANFKIDFILYLLLTLPCLLLWRRYPTYVGFYLLTLAYSVVSGFGLSHTSSIVYSGVLVTPLACYHFLRAPISLIVKRLRYGKEVNETSAY